MEDKKTSISKKEPLVTIKASLKTITINQKTRWLENIGE